MRGGESSPFPRLFSACALLWCCWCSTGHQWSASSDRIDDAAANGYYRHEGGSLCDFYQLVEPGNRSYYLYSPGYPDAYNGTELQQEHQDECRWFAKTPSFTDRLVLDCHEFDLPESQYCESDALIVSRVGDTNFTDGVRHCGPRSFTAISRTNRMNIKFVTKNGNKGGRFMCSLGAKRVDFWIPETAKNPQFCECGEQNQGVLVNEKTAGVNEFPLIASLIDGQTTNLFCGATVIGRHHALTAAHCLNYVNPSQIALLVGDHDFTSLGSDADPAMLVVVTEIYIHPLYNPSSITYNLAIVETQEEIPLSSKVSPACLPFKHVDNDFVGDTIRVLGWGAVNFEGSVSGSLQRSYMKVAPPYKCAAKTVRGDEAEQLDQLCTYLPKINKCQVDSGGPLLWSDPSTGRLNVIGVVSDRFACDESVPSVQTRLATVYNMQWVKVIMTGQYYCS